MKVVINACYGGFGLSQKALRELVNRGLSITIEKNREPVNVESPLTISYCEEVTDWWLWKTKRSWYELGLNYHVVDTIKFRTNPKLIEVVEELGEDVDTLYSNLKIIEVPDGEDVYIAEYDGKEWVAQKHKGWS